MSVLPIKLGEHRQYRKEAQDVQANLLPVRHVENRVLLVKANDARDRLRVLLNPTQLRFRQAAEWTQHAVVGLPYEPSQYNRTRNAEVSAEFYFSAFEAARQGYDLDGFNRMRYFFESLVYPEAPGRAPPRIAFIWPNVLSFLCVVDSQETEFVKFSPPGHPEIFTIGLDMFEVHGLRYAPQVAKRGIFITNPQREALGGFEENSGAPETHINEGAIDVGSALGGT